MRPDLSGLSLLGAMITPAVLISACGTLIFSTSSRLARVVDRARSLRMAFEDLARRDFPAERRAELESQAILQTRRVRLIQRSLAALYLSLGFFVATTIAIALTYWAGFAGFLPGALGVAGTLVLFLGCVLLIEEARLALRGVEQEMSFALRLRDMSAARRGRGGIEEKP